MNHDLPALERLVRRHQAGLLAFARGVGLDAQDAEDVVQDAFLAAWARQADFDPRRGTFRAWLYRITRNRALNHLRKKRARPRAVLPDAGAWPRTCEPAAFSRLDRALAALPLEQRAAFVLAEIHELSHAEVAAVEGVPVGTVKSRVARARAKLRASLGCAVEQTA